MKKFMYQDHEDSLLPELPEGKTWKLVWNDEFDGTELDRTKWGFRTNFWGKKFETFTEEGVVLDGKSHLELHVTKKDGIYRTPFLQTGSLTYDIPANAQDGFMPFGPKETPKFMHKYGYYECRCKLQKQEGWWTAFWLQAPGIGATSDPAASGVECDIMESFRPGYVIPHCLHYNGYGRDYHGFNSHGIEKVDTEHDGTPISTDEFHYFGVHWEPDGYTFYIDGVQSGHKVSEAVSHTEQFLLISAECKGYREGKPHLEDLDAMTLPECFTVDHVRVFDIVDTAD